MSISRAPLTAAGVTARLRAAGCVFAEDEARLLIEAAGTPSELATMVERRIGGLPLEHVIGWTEFCGLRIAVDEGVFVPRHRTEFLVEQAFALGHPGAVVVDLCCGSGALGAVMAATIDPLELHATDIDPAAVSCARRNLVSSAAQVYEGDLYAPLPAALRGGVDIVVANVPYVPSAEIELLPREARIYEPRSALDGGEDGLDIARRVAREATAWLRAGGHVLVETTERQASRAADIFSRNGLVSRVERCEELEATVVIGASPATVSL